MTHSAILVIVRLATEPVVASPPSWPRTRRKIYACQHLSLIVTSSGKSSGKSNYKGQALFSVFK